METVYYILYEDPEFGNRWETVTGEPAMLKRILELMNDYDIEEDEIVVFRQENRE